MGRRTVVICNDDLTGAEVPETAVEDVSLRFGYDEWKLVITPDSKAKVKEMLADIVKNGQHIDHRPKWLRDQEDAAQTASDPDTSQPQPAVTIVPPDSAAVRRWWADLTPATLRTLNLDAPKSSRGKIPELVMAAFVEAHRPPAAHVPAFTG